MKSFSELAKSVKFKNIGMKTILIEKDPTLQFVGKGRSAFVFRIQLTNKVLKVFFPPFTNIASEEAEIYRLLHGTPYFPAIYDSGSNYLVIDYIEGNTLFDCLAKGITITPDEIKEVDIALKLVTKRGLHPSDIHLRNIIITPNKDIRLIDVARYKQTNNCDQWNDLKFAFHKFYQHKLFPKKIPILLLNMIALLYKKNLLPSYFTQTYSQSA